MRNIIDVIEQIKKLYNKYDNVNIDNFTYYLDVIKYSVSFTAPEMMYIRWNELYKLLTNILLDDVMDKHIYDYNFTIKCFSIFSGNSEEDLRNEIK